MSGIPETSISVPFIFIDSDPAVSTTSSSVPCKEPFAFESESNVILTISHSVPSCFASILTGTAPALDVRYSVRSPS